MKHMIKSAVLATVFGLGALSIGAQAQASTITFGGANPGVFSGSVAEAGYTYSSASGALYSNIYGNPGEDMEGYGAGGGGVLSIVSSTAGTFTYSGLDFAAYDSSGGGDQTLTVSGYLGGALVATDAYTLTSTATIGTSYANWTPESASALSGQTIDELLISMDGSVPADSDYFYTAIDNVNLSGGVPEPAAWAMMLVGFGGMGMALRSRRARAAAVA